MPSGYTCDIKNGISFEEYALRCAKAFGACITMRDDPSDTPIPDEFVLDNYHLKEKNKAIDKLKKLNQMTDIQVQQEIDKEHSEKVKYEEEKLKEDTDLFDKYTEMLSKVKAWKAPSDDHTEYKKFMIEQIERSIEWDCRKSTDLSIPPKPSPEEWVKEKIKGANWDIEYHTKNYNEEAERISGRNKWIKQLRESLQGE